MITYRQRDKDGVIEVRQREYGTRYRERTIGSIVAQTKGGFVTGYYYQPRGTGRKASMRGEIYGTIAEVKRSLEGT